MEEKEKRQEGHHQGFVKPLSWGGNKTPRGASAAGGVRGRWGARGTIGGGAAEPRHRNFAPSRVCAFPVRRARPRTGPTHRAPGRAPLPRPSTARGLTHLARSRPPPAVPGPSRGRAGPPGSVRGVCITHNRVSAAKSAVGAAGTPARVPLPPPGSAAARQVHQPAINNN